MDFLQSVRVNSRLTLNYNVPLQTITLHFISGLLSFLVNLCLSNSAVVVAKRNIKDFLGIFLVIIFFLFF